MKTRTCIHLVLTLSVLISSGCASASTRRGSTKESRSVIARVFTWMSGTKKAKPTPDRTAQPLPVAQNHQPPQVAAYSPALRSAPSTLQASALPHYTVTRPETLYPDTQVAASRISAPAEHRVLYFPAEQGSDWAAEEARVIVRVKNEEMRANPFGGSTRGGSNLVLGGRDTPTARDYVSPTANAGDAASRLYTPRSSGSNTANAVGLYRTAEYRRAKVRTAQGDVSGVVRPLGVVGNDPRSLAAAQQALNPGAGERLVYFPNDFGWGGFVPDEPAQH